MFCHLHRELGKQQFLKRYNKSLVTLKYPFRIQHAKPRANEVDSVDYFFITKDKFEKKIKNNEFYEFAKIFNNYYGTSKKSVNDLKDKNFNILFDIDWQGTNQLSKYKELNFVKYLFYLQIKMSLKKD